MYSCPTCGDSFKKIGTHWSRGECDYPEISGKQHEVITGMLMGDASLNRSNKYPRLQCNMIKEEYLKFVDSLFPTIGSGVSLKRTASENAELSRQTGFTSNVIENNYSDQYRWQTLTHPAFEEYASWYESGEKVWPESITLTPNTLKHLYCNDGSIEKVGEFYRIKITMSNEISNKKKISNIFTNSQLPAPDYWSDEKDARWNKSSSKKLLNYMGTPLPGFEYKWPEQLSR